MKEQIKSYFNRYVKLDDYEIDKLYSRLSIKTFNKKEFLLEQNKTCDQTFFITRGLVRSFHTDEKGIENINQFAIENWWVTNTESFIKNTPSSDAIQALEKTTCLCLSKSNLEALYISTPKLERVFRMIAENTLIAIQRKDKIYMKQSSKERYFNLVNNFPDFAQRVPQYMIASYLDITPEYLSEIRKKS